MSLKCVELRTFGTTYFIHRNTNKIPNKQTKPETKPKPNQTEPKAHTDFLKRAGAGCSHGPARAWAFRRAELPRTPPWLTCCLGTHHQAGANVTTAHAKVQPLLCMRNWIQTLFLSHKPSNCYGSNQLLYFAN